MGKKSLLISLVWVMLVFLPAAGAMAGGSYHEKNLKTFPDLLESTESEPQANALRGRLETSMPIRVDGMEVASGLIEDFLKLDSPTDQDLEKLKADPSIRNYGLNAAVIMMRTTNISTRDGRPQADFDLEKNLRLFRLFETLSESFPTPDSKAKPKPSLWSEEEKSAEPLVFMIRTFEAAQDKASAQVYYDRLKALDDPSGSLASLVVYHKAVGAMSLIRLYCRSGDTPSAVKIYDDLGSNEGRLYAAAALVQGFSETGRLEDARKYYDDIVAQPKNAVTLWAAIESGQVLADHYRKSGEFTKAEKLAGEIEIFTEQQRLENEKFNEELEKRFISYLREYESKRKESKRKAR